MAWKTSENLTPYTIKPVYNGTSTTRTVSVARSSLLIQVFEVWIIGSPDHPLGKFVPLTTGFRYAQVQFKTGLLYNHNYKIQHSKFIVCLSVCLCLRCRKI